MGCYINPLVGSKEEWLKVNATPVQFKQAKEWTDFKENFLICLIDNFAFRAAGIAFNERERDEFCGISGRPCLYYSAPKYRLFEVSQLEDYLSLTAGGLSK